MSVHRILEFDTKKEICYIFSRSYEACFRPGGPAFACQTRRERETAMFRQVVCLVAVLFGFQAFGQDNAPEVIGKVQPAPGKLAVIAPPITQSTFTGEDVKVHVGMKVKKKQLLIMISETAGVLDARRFDIDRAKARLKAAEVTLCYAEKALKRINALCPAKAVAECDQELHEGAFRKAEADLAVAQKELKIAEQALVLATCPIAAPIDGTVISLSVRPGESSGPGRERLIWVRFSMPRLWRWCSRLTTVR